MRLDKGFDEARGLSPPDGEAQQDRVVLLYVFYGGFEGGTAGFIVHFLVGAAIGIAVIQVGFRIGDFRFDAEQVGVQEFGGIFRQ